MYTNVAKRHKGFAAFSTDRASVERTNSSLRFIKNRMRSFMGEYRFNALILLFEQKYIKLDIEEIINNFVKNHP